MRKYILRSVIVTCLILFAFSCDKRNRVIDKSKLYGNDFRLFQETPVWELCKAVEDEEIKKINSLLKEDHLDINYQEKRFGQTLLTLAVLNEKVESSKELLKNGADPNIYDTYDGRSAIICAAGITNNKRSIDFLKLLIKHGANPNDHEIGTRREGNSTRKTPLLVACEQTGEEMSQMEKVKFLVGSGADVNYKNEFNVTPLKSALMNNYFDIVLYLLEKGADFKAPISRIDNKDFYLQDELRFIIIPLNSKLYPKKMKLVEFLKEKGINYENTPIPDYAIEEAKKIYPKNWKAFLEKY